MIVDFTLPGEESEEKYVRQNVERAGQAYQVSRHQIERIHEALIRAVSDVRENNRKNGKGDLLPIQVRICLIPPEPVQGDPRIGAAQSWGYFIIDKLDKRKPENQQSAYHTIEVVLYSEG